MAPNSAIRIRPQFLPLPKLSSAGLRDALPCVLEPRVERRFFELHSDINRQDDKHRRDQERHAPAPIGKGRLAKAEAAQQDHEQREDDAHRRGGLNPGGIKPAPAVGRVLGDIGRRAAIFAAERQTLQHAHRDEQDRRQNADRLVARQQPDDKGRGPHQQQGQHEGELAADQIAEIPEHDRAERPDQEPGPEHEQAQDEGQPRIERRREEVLAEKDGKDAVQVEIVPLDQRADRGCADDERQVGTLAGRAGCRISGGGHFRSVSPRKSRVGRPVDCRRKTFAERERKNFLSFWYSRLPPTRVPRLRELRARHPGCRVTGARTTVSASIRRSAAPGPARRGRDRTARAAGLRHRSCR